MSRETWLYGAIGVALCGFALAFAGLGFFIIDEAIYVFAADSFRQSGSLLLENGLEGSTSGDLRWTRLLTLGPNGLTSQYPPGSTVVWSWLLPVFDTRGIVLFNAAATTACLFVLHRLAKDIFKDNAVALGTVGLFLFGTFSLEYAFTIWPHMPAVLSVTLCILLFLRSLEASFQRALWMAVASGFVLGLGITFRLDCVLVLPAIAILAIVLARHPLPVLLGGAIGLAPAMAALAWANAMKFGSPNPLNYGKSEGFTNVALYVPLAGAMAAGLLVLLAVRLWGGKLKLGRSMWIGLALAAAAAAAFVPQVQTALRALAWGAWVLLIDSRAIVSPLAGIEAQPDGTTSFWGLSKKALGQSMPWIGGLALLASFPIWRGRRREVLILLTFTALWLVPFLLRAWHGGMSSNMRYFLPILPLVCVLGAWLIVELHRRSGLTVSPAVVATALGFLGLVAWAISMPTGLAGAHQIASLLILALVSICAFCAAIYRTQALARIAVLSLCFGVGASAFNTVSDTAVSQIRRHANSVLADVGAGVEGRAVVYSYLFRSAMQNPEQIIAMPDTFSEGPDADLVARALAAGYRVLMPEALAAAFVTQSSDFAIVGPAESPLPMLEIGRSDG